LIHTGKEAAAGKSAVQRKIVVKYLFFKANAKLENAFKKRPVFTIMLMVKSGKNSGKIRDFFFCESTLLSFLKPKEREKETLSSLTFLFFLLRRHRPGPRMI